MDSSGIVLTKEYDNLHVVALFFNFSNSFWKRSLKYVNSALLLRTHYPEFADQRRKVSSFGLYN